MIRGIDKKKLGKLLLHLRKARCLTQKQVAKSINVNTETLRRIENGYNIPSIQTLELLSSVYKTNLLKEISSLSYLNRYSEFYDKLDKLLVSYSVEELSKTKDAFATYTNGCEEEYYDHLEIKQFQMVLEGLEKYYSDDCLLQDSTDCFILSIQLRHSDFDIVKYSEHIYLPIEIKALYLIAMNYCNMQNYLLSNEILLYLIEKHLRMVSFQDSPYQFKLSIKAYLNLSYNCHCLDEFELSLHYAEMGIIKCVSTGLFYLLYSLYYRKAIALMRLKRDEYEYLIWFKRSISMLEIQESYDLIDVYRQVTKDKWC